MLSIAGGLDRSWDTSSVSFPLHISYYFELICPIKGCCSFI